MKNSKFILSNMSNIAILIPARLASVRFPNKPLIDILGEKMVVRVCKQAAKSKFSDIFVACSESETKNIVEEAGFKAIMTDPNLPSGTDRIYAAYQQIKREKDYDIIVNLQGDLPNIDPEIINHTVEVLELDKAADIATAVVELDYNSDLADDPNVVKAVVNFNDKNYNNVLYFSRAKTPHNTPILYEHLGLYAYRKEVLEAFVKLDVSYFEKYEKLEQLRALENGFKISACLITEQEKPIAIDTKEDLERLLKIM
jgi:3-deoxy-manno-octulosonate cytidylyltransferase (CMP-KDO synthetase)